MNLALLGICTVYFLRQLFLEMSGYSGFHWCCGDWGGQPFMPLVLGWMHISSLPISPGQQKSASLNKTFRLQWYICLPGSPPRWIQWDSLLSRPVWIALAFQKQLHCMLILLSCTINYWISLFILFFYFWL